MSGVTGLQPIPLYLSYAGQETKYANASLKTNPLSSAELAYFTKVAPSITTPAALLKDYKALSVVLGAFGMQDSIGQTAIIQKLLTQDPTSKTSLAQTIGNTKFLLFAKAMSNWNPPPFSTASGVAQIAASFTTNVFEKTADTQSPGLAAALQFTRQASTLTSVAAVQSDPNLLNVVVTTLGLPLQNFQELDFDQQTKILQGKLNLSDFQNPAKVKQYAEQYLVSQQSTADAGPASGTVASLFDDGADTSGDSVLSLLDPTSSGSSGSTSANTLSLFA